MANFREARDAVVARILEREGMSSKTDRRAAFDNEGSPDALGNLIRRVAAYAYKITDDDVVAVKNAGYSEDQIFELVVTAAIGQATRQSKAALAALDAVTKED